jgi:hypothetical protein
MSWKKLHDDIFLFENILTEEIVQKGLAYVKENSDLQSCGLEEDSELFTLANQLWFQHVEDVLHDEYLKHIPKEKEQLQDLRTFIRSDWRDMFFLRYYPENTKNLRDFVHADFSTWTFSAAFLSSDDYEGGELCFPRQSIKHKLNKGDMIVFPGGLTHMHYTENISQGERIVLVGQSMTYKQDHRLGKKL